MSRIDWKKEDIEDIVKRYKEGISQCQLAKDYNCSRNAIKTVLNKNFVKVRDIHEANIRKIDESIVEQVIYNYTVLGQGAPSAGKDWKISQDKVEKILKERGVKLRTYIESKQVQRIYNIDDNFFKNQNEDMAYILGFIAADGNVAKKENCISIEVHEKDKNLLEIMREKTNNTRPLKFYLHIHEDCANTPAVKFQTWSAEWKKDLAIYNIVPEKTFILKPPTFLNKQYYGAFIKGYFDGDGSVYKAGNHIEVAISGVSKEMISWMREILATQYGIIGIYDSYLTPNKKHLMYRVRYNSDYSLSLLYKLWYEDNSSNLYLPRKKEIFTTYFKK